jgi:hypothetical protein
MHLSAMCAESESSFHRLLRIWVRAMRMQTTKWQLLAVAKNVAN